MSGTELEYATGKRQGVCCAKHGSQMAYSATNVDITELSYGAMRCPSSRMVLCDSGTELAGGCARPFISASIDILDFASILGSMLYVLAGLMMYP
eukprot:2377496-Rhodomonas_salina.2